MSLTSANSVFTLIIPGLYPIPQTLEGYSTDDAFSFDDIEIAETRMGVDGIMSSGYVPNIFKSKITFQADSKSIAIFDFLIQTSKTQRSTYRLEGTVLLPATGKSYNLVNGVLVSGKPLPDAKKVLEPQSYGVHWNDIQPAFV